MLSDELPKQVSLLVDHLRKTDKQELTLSDVASVSEVLIRTMSAFFKSVDTTIYRECRALSDYIESARLEIANLQPVDLESDRIPRAGLELNAIVEHTEEATNTIMEAAEEIMSLDPADTETYTATTQDAVMRIFEACSFQDITGQRISKVVQTLEHIEERVLSLRDLMGITEAHIQQVDDEASEKVAASGDKALLRGPALDGEGIDQTDVDALMGGDSAPAPSPAPVPAPAPEPAQKPKAEPKAEAKPKPKAPPPPPAPPPAPKAVDPRALDQMFEEDFDPVADLEKKDAGKDPEPEAKADTPKKDDESKNDVELKEGAEVSQDDIDALFG